MDIQLSQLKEATYRIFQHLESLGITTVTIPHDFYWYVPKESRYNPYSAPNNLTLGQLSDDIGELQRIIDGKADPVAYAMVWLAAVFQAVGEEVVA